MSLYDLIVEHNIGSVILTPILIFKSSKKNLNILRKIVFDDEGRFLVGAIGASSINLVEVESGQSEEKGGY
jgi:hypothetical protein